MEYQPLCLAKIINRVIMSLAASPDHPKADQYDSRHSPSASPPPSASSPSAPSTKKLKIAIIGAGLSGLTMGYRLNQKGCNISIYEARSRVGGRVHTVYVKNLDGAYSLAELGGQNITDGGEARHFLNLARELGLEIEEDPHRLSRAFYADGKIHDSTELLKTCNFSQDRLEQTLTALASTAHSIADIIEHLFAGNSFLKRMFTYYMGAYEGLPPQNLATIPNIKTLKYFLPGGLAASQEINGTDEPFLLKSVKGGNSRLPLALAKSLESKVFLEKILWKVSREQQGIKLEFRDNTTVICDRLIVSVPCSTIGEVLWDNLLMPQEKLDTLHKVQYGSNGKIIIPVEANGKGSRYSAVNADHIGAFHNNDYNLLVLYTDGVWGKKLGANLKDYYPSMLEMAEASYGTMPDPRSPPLMASEILYKKYEGPIVKSWAEDPYAKGSYSSVGTLLGNEFLRQATFNNIPVKAIFAPVNDQIFFIGEHTSLLAEGGTMEAAVESAERLSKAF